jgi:hypothetical protein
VTQLGYALLIAKLVVVGSSTAVTTIEEASPEHNIQSIPVTTGATTDEAET